MFMAARLEWAEWIIKRERSNVKRETEIPVSNADGDFSL
jgi:hypothetical protein